MGLPGQTAQTGTLIVTNTLYLLQTYVFHIYADMLQSSEFIEPLFLDEEVNGGVHEVVEDRSHSKNATQNADDIDEQSVPLIVWLNQQHSHGVGLIPV